MDDKNLVEENKNESINELGESELTKAILDQSATIELDAPVYVDRVRKKKKKGVRVRGIVVVPFAALVFFLGMIVEHYRVLGNMEVNDQYFLMDDAQLNEIKDETSKEATTELYEKIKNYGQETQVNVKFMRKMFPDKLVLKSDGEFLYLPIDETIEKNSYDYSRLEQTDKFFEYKNEEGNVISKKGIDVSKFQGEIDWELVKEDGVEFAILRAGYRGYGSGKLVLDEMFMENLEGTKEQNIDIGVYFYSQATSKEEAVEEAQMVIEALRGYDVTYPVVLDTEAPSGEGARTEGLTNEERTEYILAFCETIEEAGYIPMIYSNLNWFILKTDYKALSKYDIWLANYDTQPYFPYDFKMWQYSEKGAVNGIEGDVDLNICFKDYSKEE
ncbi:MAG: glycoside hydrolase family 25 protein [Lachnospiraceae bacterium]|nr:glycoside hydrolase family 25 protein [Lachnospiraceae bacterium]